MTWDRQFYFPSEGRRAEDFFALKIQRIGPGLNPRTWVLKGSTLPIDHRSRFSNGYANVIRYTHIACNTVHKVNYRKVSDLRYEILKVPEDTR